MTPPKSERVQAVDWFRGLAVLVMVQCHALALLRPELRRTEATAWLLRVDGLVAPAFLFTAGFALALVQLRTSGTPLGARMRASLGRIGKVLGAATLVNGMWFPLLTQPRWLFRIDILHCIGLSLLMALPLVAPLATRPRLLRWASLATGLALFLVAPFGESVTGPFAGLFNKGNDSVFPVLVWVGYVFLGASAGTLASRRELVRWMGLLGALGVLLWALTPVSLDLYPPHTFWLSNPSNHAQRWVFVCGALALLLVGERALLAAPWRAAALRWVAGFGAASLSAYVFHEALLFRSVGGVSFEAVWGNRSGWVQYAVLTVTLIALTAVLCRLWKRASGMGGRLVREQLPAWREARAARPVLGPEQT
ncbi:MAG: DUF1624 domain-containing protein [Myxococcaceae bacterium]|nr:DUF1624 domain-containing protein [Myxococcaceae bacterium]MCI0670681.1 DUF1624 domain-containing protein [Myxococcaceae bacterium]